MEWHGLPVGTWVQFIAAVFALAGVTIAFVAWRLNRSSYRTSFRPVIRPVPTRTHSNQIATDRLILKNYGKGPAFSVMLFQEDAVFLNDGPIGIVDVVEPLGSGPLESRRLGRVVLNASVANDRRYRLLYQDLEGRFHETEFVTSSQGFTVQYRGSRLIEEIPRWAHDIAAMVGPEN